MERQLRGHSQEIKRSLIPKEELLVIMSSIRKECGEELRKLREHSRQG